MLKQKLVSSIKEFEEYVGLGNKLLIKKFNLNSSPILNKAPKGIINPSGVLYYKEGEMKYRFHGTGCEFIYNKNTIVDFNYDTNSWKYIGFSLFKFWQFVKNRIPEFNDKELLKEYLKQLEDEGIIENKAPPFIAYKLAMN